MPRAKHSDLRVSIGRRLQRARAARGLTQERLAELVGINAISLCRVETGKRSLSLGLITRAADVLGIGVADLVDPGRKLPKATLAPEEAELLRGFRSLSPSWRKLTLAIVAEASR